MRLVEAAKAAMAVHASKDVGFVGVLGGVAGETVHREKEMVHHGHPSEPHILRLAGQLEEHVERRTQIVPVHIQLQGQADLFCHVNLLRCLSSREPARFCVL